MPDNPLAGLLESPTREWLAFALGLSAGSFANVCIHRLPRGGSVSRPRSRCPSCAAPIRPWDNIPLVSYLLLRGRCRSCRAPISWRYPAVEAANALLYLVLALALGPVAEPAAILRTLALMALTTALLVLGLIDLEHQILPDAITLPGIGVGVAASFLPGPPTPLESVLSALAGYLSLMLIARAHERLRGIEGLGQGDWKMVAMLGAFLGWQRLLLTVLLATTLGSLAGALLILFFGGTGKTRVPLGSFLALAALVVVFVGDPLLDWYRGLFDV